MGRTKQRQHANRPKPSTDPLFDSSEGSIKGVRGYNAQDLDLNGQDLFELQQDAIGLEDATQAGDSDDEDGECFLPQHQGQD